MRVLILGSGGREHALAWKVSQSPLLEDLYVLPGNAGTKNVAKNITSISTNDFAKIRSFILEEGIDLVIVGPEDLLAKGIVDFLEEENILVLGPNKSATRLESSKDFAKNFMLKYNIPTADFKTFVPSQEADAIRYLESQEAPYVIKADGLAAGKGVLINKVLEHAKESLKRIFSGKFGDAGNKVVIESFLRGIELSVFVVTDGKKYVTLPAAKDYKRIGEGDTGLNTGGMGAVSPLPFADRDFMQKVDTDVIRPTLKGLQQEHIDYKGFIFFGLMNHNGQPKVIEYNARMGDPEAQVLLPLIQEDMLLIFKHAAERKLENISLSEHIHSGVTVILASEGYPEKYETGNLISKLEDVTDAYVFHAGTKENEQAQVVTNGGRVLAITAIAKDKNTSIAKAYKEIEKIDFRGKYCRKDIGADI